jgi:hypothetical protein
MQFSNIKTRCYFRILSPEAQTRAKHHILENRENNRSICSVFSRIISYSKSHPFCLCTAALLHQPLLGLFRVWRGRSGCCCSSSNRFRASYIKDSCHTCKNGENPFCHKGSIWYRYLGLFYLLTNQIGSLARNLASFHQMAFTNTWNLASAQKIYNRHTEMNIIMQVQ